MVKKTILTEGPTDARLMKKMMREMMWSDMLVSYQVMTVAAQNTVESGRQAWKRIKSSSRQRQNYRDWQALMDAFEVGESACGEIAGKMSGGAYARLLSRWVKLNGFADIPTSVRSYMREVRQHQTEIDAWRNNLPPEQRHKLNHPRTILQHFKAASSRHK